MKQRFSIALFLMLFALAAPRGFACAACYGKSDSAMAEGMNWGIFTLLGIIGLVLVGVASFFVFMIRRAAALSADATPTSATATRI